MSTKSFKIPYGEREGQLLHVSEVERGLQCDCVCPVCKERLVARKGHKTHHHFAHYPGANCSAETVLHQLGKRLLHCRVVSAIQSRESLPIAWECKHCLDEHKGDLVKVVEKAALEMSLGACRPDVTLLAENGHPVAFLEVVVSHSPDEKVLAYAAKRGIPVVEFHVSSAEDLEAIERAATLRPTRMDLCPRPRCPECGKPLRRKVIHVVEGKCWNCGAPMKIAMVSIEGELVGPEGFEDEEVLLARQLGAILRTHYSRTVRQSYLASTCGRCGKFVGSFHVHEYSDLLTTDNGHQVGYACPDCDMHH